MLNWFLIFIRMCQKFLKIAAVYCSTTDKFVTALEACICSTA